MTQDVSPLPTPHPWKKAIPEARDRLQSKILVWIALPLLIWLVSETRQLPFTEPAGMRHLLTAGAASLVFALGAWRLKAATPLGALSGSLICFLISFYTAYLRGFFSYGGGSIFHTGLTPLILLFIMTFFATRFRKERKDAPDADEERRGRSAAQIIANLGVAGALASLRGQFYVTSPIGWVSLSGTGSHDMWLPVYALFRIPVLAALAEATADTVASEIGQAFPGKTYLITTLRSVPAGTDGGISLSGTAAGISAAAVIAAVGRPALDLTALECGLVLLAATLGLLFDSLLGATVERKGWLGNDLVNLASTAFAGLVSAFGIRFL